MTARPPGGRYGEALRWLFSFADWERGVGWNPAAAPDEQWKLGRTRALLDLAGAPDRDLRIVLIAGTKGKGSTGAMLEAIVRVAGWRTGLYSQPHLHTYRERVKLDGRRIAPEHFAALVDRLRPLVDELRARHPEAGEPTTFELTTVLAILAATEHRADLAILEVGLGGRLDATNATDPLISVITTIGHDHTRILGRTLREIASEKAGIIRPDGTVVSARQRPPARDVIAARCKALGANLRVMPPLRRAHADETRVAFRLDGGASFAARLGLAGGHQRQNAAIAVAVAAALVPHGLPLSAQAAGVGLESAWLPGRFERVGSRPLIVLDTAHNRDSAAALAGTLHAAAVPRPIWLVLGILRDKDARGVARPLAGTVDGAVVVTPPSRRALAATELAAVCLASGIAAVEESDDVATALERARELAGPDGTVVVTGSFSTVAAARVALGLVSPAELDPV